MDNSVESRLRSASSAIKIFISDTRNALVELPNRNEYS
jgi:hypothetical protein